MSKTETVAVADIQAMNFEQAMAELDSIVQRLEAGRVPLEESIVLYSRGMALKHHCEAKLKAASEKIESIAIESNGTISTSTTPTD